jgi:hypothetical protein
LDVNLRGGLLVPCRLSQRVVDRRAIRSHRVELAVDDESRGVDLGADAERCCLCVAASNE